MQLWKKNYLITFLLFLLVLNTGLFCLSQVLFQNDLERWMEMALMGEQRFAYAVSEFEDTSDINEQIKYICRGYYTGNARMTVLANGESIVNYVPADLKFSYSADIVTYSGRKYVLLHDTEEIQGKFYEIIYMEDISQVYKEQKERLAGLACVSLMLAAIIGTMLYITMKKIYKPVNHIAHELRNPLTVIQGYGQYVQMGNICGEDCFFAGQQIVKEARTLAERVDRLLIMGNLREGTIRCLEINADTLFQELKESYEGLETENDIISITGDPNLIKCLFQNLISNGKRAGERVKLTGKGKYITVWNDGKEIGEEELRYLNKNHRWPRETVKNNGFGIALCYDIIKLHRWKMSYASSREEGTTVTIQIME
ncbi:sensor histidine kinase [Lactonifactor longoviformis]|uniref:histidine kinase n=3 Tax=Lactonifactor TaxID=420345 RepID=A0A1M4X073_9CLOT|nr:HAMP domain-containing sensor histidine kinase [Lactonifactor longoviformis]SHE86860.1 Histidine kinase-, DNA gyrase B-, and HSP90-like ATPase [Lactonifactor longoviformis DSM 17459]